MKRRTNEVAAEIAALKALKPVGPFARKTAATIEIQIEELEHGVDRTAPEWEELDLERQMAADDAMLWKSGESDTRPSSDFGRLVE